MNCVSHRWQNLTKPFTVLLITFYYNMDIFFTFLTAFLWVLVVFPLLCFGLYAYCDLFDKRLHRFFPLSEGTGILIDIHTGSFTVGFIDYRL